LIGWLAGVRLGNAKSAKRTLKTQKKYKNLNKKRSAIIRYRFALSAIFCVT
jgi:hypothetical protein